MPLWGHNDTPCWRPTPRRPIVLSAAGGCLQFISISNDIPLQCLPYLEIYPQQRKTDYRHESRKACKKCTNSYSIHITTHTLKLLRLSFLKIDFFTLLAISRLSKNSVYSSHNPKATFPLLARICLYAAGVASWTKQSLDKLSVE
jgi:hypothetical protein